MKKLLTATVLVSMLQGSIFAKNNLVTNDNSSIINNVEVDTSGTSSIKKLTKLIASIPGELLATWIIGSIIYIKYHDEIVAYLMKDLR